MTTIIKVEKRPIMEYKDTEAVDTGDRQICVFLNCKDDSEADMYMSYILNAIGKGLY